MAKNTLIFIFYMIGYCACGQEGKMEGDLVGVYQGKTLFIQNPFNKADKSFCIEKVLVNGRVIDLNYAFSALKIDFDGFERNTPVRIRILTKDSLCSPVIINPEAVLFHTIFRFSDIKITDSTLFWVTKGERGIGEFEVQRLSEGIWTKEAVIEAQGSYERSQYNYFPQLEEGSNKYRVKYNFPLGSRISHLYSFEVEYHFYPEPIVFEPKSVKRYIKFSRYSSYEIYDMGLNLITSGEGTEVDLSTVRIRRGRRYLISFEGKYPGVFYCE